MWLRGEKLRHPSLDTGWSSIRFLLLHQGRRSCLCWLAGGPLVALYSCSRISRLETGNRCSVYFYLLYNVFKSLSDTGINNLSVRCKISNLLKATLIHIPVSCLKPVTDFERAVVVCVNTECIDWRIDFKVNKEVVHSVIQICVRCIRITVRGSQSLDAESWSSFLKIKGRGWASPCPSTSLS